mgnify:CR=1 FL=1
MANTKIVLNRQSDLILNNAQIVDATGIVKGDLPGLVDDLANLNTADLAEASFRVAGDNSLEAKIDADVSSEQSAREAGDLSLTTKVDADVSTEKAAREAAVTAEASARVAGDALLQSNMDTFESRHDSEMSSEISAREAADLAEASSRLAADTILQSNLDTEEAERLADVTTLQLNIDNESSRAQVQEVANADAIAAETSNRILDVNAEEARAIAAEGSLDTKLGVEENARIAGDTNLQSNIDVEKGRIDAILSGSSVDLDQFKEVVDFVEAIDLENDNALLAAVNSINTAITDEVNARTAADTAVRTDMTDAILSAKTDVELQVSDEITARQSAITSFEARHDGEMTAVEADLVAETSSRIAGDTTLQASIDTLTSDLADEVADRTKADTSVVTKFNTEMAAELSTRLAGDNSLEAKIDADISTEKLARETADSSIEDKITDIISNTDFTAMDSFSEVTNHLDRLEDNHMVAIPVMKIGSTGDKKGVVGLGFNGVTGGLKQDTIQVFLNGQLLVEGVDWTEAASVDNLGEPGASVAPAAGDAVGGVDLIFEGTDADNFTVYGVKFETGISYGY